MKAHDYVLIYGGGCVPGKRPGTQLAKLHSRNRRGDAWRGTIIFASGRWTKTLRPIEDSWIIAHWPYKPKPSEVEKVRKDLARNEYLAL